MLRRVLSLAVVGVVSFGAVTEAAIRVVTYNIDADTTSYESNGVPDATSVQGVFQAIGSQTLAGNAQAPDVISLQELYKTGPTTLLAMVTDLNAVYGAGTYAYDTFVDPTTGSSNVGNGPSGLIYNTKTIKVVGTPVSIGTPDGSGEARAPVRYQLQSLTAAANNTFYLYDEHTKALSGADNALRRTYEVDAVRADADKLATGSHVIYTGDFNLAGSSGKATTGSNEQAYKDLVAASGTTLATNGDPNSSAAALVAGSVGRAYDPLTTSFTNSTAGQVQYFSESNTDVTARFDLQMISSNVLPGSAPAGLQLVPQTELSFGNSYYNSSGVLSTGLAVGGDITDSAATGLSSTVLTELEGLSDHLPVIADYTIAVPEPTAMAVFGFFVVAGLRRRA